MKLESVLIADALDIGDYKQAVSLVANYFGIPSIASIEPRITSDLYNRAIIVASDGISTYRWSNDRGFSSSSRVWLYGLEIRLGLSWVR